MLIQAKMNLWQKYCTECQLITFSSQIIITKAIPNWCVVGVLWSIRCCLSLLYLCMPVLGPRLLFDDINRQ